jgi:hypothetical protein
MPSLLDSLFPRRRDIQSLTADDLRKHLVTLNNEEKRLESELIRLRDDQARVVEEYARVKALGDARHIRFLGRRFEEILALSTHLDRRHAYISRQARVINSIALLKDSEAFAERLGNTDLAAWQTYVEEASVKAELQVERLETLQQTLDDAVNQQEIGREDDLPNALAELDRLAEQHMAAKHGDETLIDAAIAKVDQALNLASSANEAKS